MPLLTGVYITRIKLLIKKPVIPQYQLEISFEIGHFLIKWIDSLYIGSRPLLTSHVTRALRPLLRLHNWVLIKRTRTCKARYSRSMGEKRVLMHALTDRSHHLLWNSSRCLVLPSLRFPLYLPISARNRGSSLVSLRGCLCRDTILFSKSYKLHFDK